MMIGVVLAAIMSVGTAITTTSSTHCCGPRKFKATMLETGGTFDHRTGTGSAVESVIMFNHDYDRKMSYSMVQESNLATGVHTNVSTINDYLNAKLYILTSDGHCYSQYLDPSLLFDPCGSPNFTVTAQYSIGSASAPVNLYQIEGMYGSYKMTITITTDDCTPVTQTLAGQNMDGKSEGLYTFLYTNVQKGVVDDSLFNVPAACSSPIAIPLGKRNLEALVGRRMPF